MMSATRRLLAALLPCSPSPSSPNPAAAGPGAAEHRRQLRAAGVTGAVPSGAHL
jgi:hypothetical protein